jgi:solute:Na+ symporter, SSS family
MILIVVGLLVIAWVTSGLAGGFDAVIDHARQAEKFNFWPAATFADIVAFMAGILTMGFGSIPQQDVFQRVNSARTESIAVRGSIIGGSAYLAFAFVPIFVAYSASLIDPQMVAARLAIDDPQLGSQQILPRLILGYLPLGAQVLFFGAVLAAIMSTASGTLLAPSVTFSENILRGIWRSMTDRQFLTVTRVVVVVFAAMVTFNAMKTDESIHGMVENAYKITLATAFVPLAGGLYWRRATTQGALASILLGAGVWVGLELTAPDYVLPPHFAGMLAGAAAFFAGSLLPQVIRDQRRSTHHLQVGPR